jgi:hypothetical protein
MYLIISCSAWGYLQEFSPGCYFTNLLDLVVVKVGMKLIKGW